MTEHWIDSPPQDDKLPNYRILRAPAGRRISGVIVTETPIGANLHYWRGRSRPCKGAECEACQAGHQARWKGYVELFDVKLKTVAILEFTERVHPEFQRFLAINGSVRGGRITIGRLNSKPNGPLVIEFEEHRFDAKHLPAPCDLRAVLARMWEVGQKDLPGIDSAGESADETRKTY